MQFKFGKLPPKIDKRTLMLKHVLKKELPPVPDRFSVDESCGAVFEPCDYGNKKWGDCVIAARAVQTLRLEYFEQKKVVPITTDDCLNEYWKEQNALGNIGKPDDGLVMLDSLKAWRTAGWIAAEDLYTIHAFAAVNPRNKLQVQRGIFFLRGVQLGVQVPKSALDQFDHGLVWTVTETNSPIECGHCIALTGYDDFGVSCVTWGEETKIAWNWLKRYADEGFVVIDSPDTPNGAVDISKLEGYLASITS